MGLGLLKCLRFAMRRPQWISRTFHLWERLGIHVSNIHYYQPIPDTRTLDERHFESQSALVGIDMQESKQLAFLDEIVAELGSELAELPMAPVDSGFHLRNDMFQAIDAEVYYSMIRRRQPRRIIEAGSGFSTLLAEQALLRNAMENRGIGDLLVVDPFPSPALSRGRGNWELRPHAIQDLDLLEFDKLDRNDILFIDSSHVTRIDSDVRFLVLEVLPRLRPGVLVHFHDIFLPGEYPRHWLMGEHWFFNEQYLLQAFLTFNERFEVLWGSAYMARVHPAALKASMKSVERGLMRDPGSFWLLRTSL